MTKVFLFTPQQQQTKKPIEFLKSVDSAGVENTPSSKPSDYENIELIVKRNESHKPDVMLAYQDNKREYGVLFFGKWNDGIVL